MSYRNVGIDLGVTAQHQIQVRDEGGQKVCPQLSIDTSKQGFEQAAEHALSGAEPGTKIRWICEPTAMSWFPLVCYAKPRGQEVVRVKTQMSYDLRKFYNKHNHSDSLDAKALAQLPVVHSEAMQEVYLPDKDSFTLDRRTRQQRRLTQKIASIKSRIIAFFNWVQPNLTKAFTDPFCSRARAYYRHFTNPFKVRDLGLGGLAKFLANKGRQRMNPELPKTLWQIALKAGEIYELADEYVDFDELQDEILVELDDLEALEKSLSQVENAVQRLYDKVHPSKNIETITGIGKNLGPALVGKIGDSNRFSSYTKLKGFTGIVPKQDDSGESSKKGLPISHEGPSDLRRAVYIAADVARQWDPQAAKIYYDCMMEKGHCHTQAVCAVASHWSGRILRVLKDNRPYVLRDLQGNPITKKEAKKFIETHLKVPEEVRQRTRNKKRVHEKFQAKRRRSRNKKRISLAA
jgi:transposase